MKEAKKMIEELKCLVRKDDEDSAARRDEIAEWFRINHSEENINMFREFLDEGFENINIEIDDIIKCIKEEKLKK